MYYIGINEFQYNSAFFLDNIIHEHIFFGTSHFARETVISVYALFLNKYKTRALLTYQ